MKKKVLLVCYHFPPNSGIGGRKWSFLTKYLLKSDIVVHALTKYPVNSQVPPWQGVVDGVCLHYFHSNYPRVLEFYPKKIIDKLFYRLYLSALKKITKSNYYDRGVLLKNRLIKEVNKIIEINKIDNLIITGAPFSFLYYGTFIKQSKPEINFIADIRDSWIKGNYFGFDGLRVRVKEEEKNRLKKVLNLADTVLVPYPTMKEEYESLVTTRNLKLMPHAVDMEYVQKRQNNYNDGVKLLNFGSQYTDLSDIMQVIAKEILNTSMKIEFFTDDLKYQNIFFMSKKHINFNEPVTYSDMFRLLSFGNAALLFVNENIKDYLSTKYIECFSARIPIVLIGETGYVSEYLQYNRLGIFIEKTELKNKFKQIPILLKQLEYNENFDISPYTFEKQAEDISKLLK